MASAIDAGIVWRTNARLEQLAAPAFDSAPANRLVEALHSSRAARRLRTGDDQRHPLPLSSGRTCSNTGALASAMRSTSTTRAAGTPKGTTFTSATISPASTKTVFAQGGDGDAIVDIVDQFQASAHRHARRRAGLAVRFARPTPGARIRSHSRRQRPRRCVRRRRSRADLPRSGCVTVTRDRAPVGAASVHVSLAKQMALVEDQLARAVVKLVRQPPLRSSASSTGTSPNFIATARCARR